jgi:hypothetical protein
MENQSSPHIAQQQAESLARVNPPTTEQIAQHYTAMLDSVALINAVISGSDVSCKTDQERKDCVDRNVRHLEIMRPSDFWTTEDMTSIDAAIAAGKAYV